MSGLRLALRQVRFDGRSSLRNPAAVFFGLALPVLFLLIFATIFGNETLESRGNIKISTYYVPGLVCLGIVSTTLVNLAMALVVLRESRVLKRIRGTPLPSWVFIAGRVQVAIGMAFALTVVLVMIGVVVYGVTVPDTTLPGVVLALVVGAASFCCLGAALSSAIPNEDAAPAIVNAVVLPLYFISGVFFPVDDAPQWLTDIASVFPIKHLAEALLDAFDPRTTGVGIDFGHLAVVAAWGVAGLLVAMRTFRWTPKGE
jgi:ABC-2 type transport system permease protein